MSELITPDAAEAAFALSQRAGKLLSSSTLVPKDYQGNVANCVIALNMAQRLGVEPLQVMQNLYIVHGKPGWAAKFLIATFNSTPGFSKLRYEFGGVEGKDSWKCRAYATELASGETLLGSWVSIELAKKEGWYAKNGSKWQTMPEQMLMYRAASFFIGCYAPELSMGLHTADELQDMREEARRVDDGAFERLQASLKQPGDDIAEDAAENITDQTLFDRDAEFQAAAELEQQKEMAARQ